MELMELTVLMVLMVLTNGKDGVTATVRTEDIVGGYVLVLSR
jgi:hypothetical protein